MNAIKIFAKNRKELETLIWTFNQGMAFYERALFIMKKKLKEK